MSNIQRILIVLVVVVVLIVLLGRPPVLGGAPSGLSSRVATTSAITVGTTAQTVFATSTNCASRIITTAAQPIMLTLNDYAGHTPTGSFGHLQAASTTVVYDSGLYGCGAVKIYGFTANTVITVTETR
jgi:hypothetical protein